MYIEISRELVTYAEHNNRYALEMLERLALAIKYQKHIVFAGIRLLDRILSLTALDSLTLSQYRKIRSRYSTIGSLTQKIEFRAVVLMRGDNRRTRDRILINSQKAENLEVYEECHMLTENLQDGDFFKYLVDEYVKKLGTGCPICYMPQMGGGSTIAKVYKMEIDRGQHFCVAILDSDKRYPTCGKGDTYVHLKREDDGGYLGDGHSDGKYAYNCSYYVMEELRELENLIPIEVLKTMDGIKDSSLLQMPFDMSFHDMKNGLMACKIIECHYQTYLDNLFAFDQKLVDYIDFCAEYRKLCCVKKEDYETDCGKMKLVEGLGNKLMVHVLLNAEEALKNTDFTKLSPSQQTEWNNIGKKVFEWCCCLNIGLSA